MSLFLVMIYESQQAYAEISEGDAEWSRIMAGHNAFGAKHGAVIKGGEALQPTTTARTIRADGAGGFTVTDGPFLETKEALGGYYVIDADNLDQAVEIAKDVPATYGCLEVRPVMVFS